MTPRLALAIAALALAASAAPAAEVPRDRVEARIETGVALILGHQREGGRFDLQLNKPVGETALALLALEYARPYLKGDLEVRAKEAARLAAAFILQRAPEPETYSAAMAVTALSMRDVDRNRLGRYATILATSQHDRAPFAGMWGYNLKSVGETGAGAKALDAWGDNSNTQFAILGLYMASRRGFQAPRAAWERAAEHYAKTQLQNGGWGYEEKDAAATATMTIAGTVSVDLCDEMLQSASHGACEPRPRSKVVDNSLGWIAHNWDREKIGGNAYGLYALERLGILMGRANVGGHDWYNEGAEVLLDKEFLAGVGTPEANTCFVVAFLSRGLEPVIFYKLERPRTDDWNCDPWDVKHVVDYVQDHYQQSAQWRIVTLDAPLDVLRRAPILYITGHKALDFGPEETAKLRAYVEGGGTLVGEACCSKKEFADSFRALVKDAFGGEMKPVPPDHRLFELMKIKSVPARPAIEQLPIEKEGGRPGALLLPNDISCRWSTGGSEARDAFEAGSGIYLYVTNDARQLYLRAHPLAAP